MRGGAIDDYTYLWWDVRPHPNLGTVEVRVFDQQTSLDDDDRAGGADRVAMAHRLSAPSTTARSRSVEYPTELVDDNKVRAAMRGMDGHPRSTSGSASRSPRERTRARLLDEPARATPRSWAANASSETVEELLAGNTGRAPPARGCTSQRPRPRGRWSARSSRQPSVVATGPPGYPRLRMSTPELSVVCRNCGSEVSPYVTECPYCGTRLRKRAPKLQREGDEIKVREGRRERRLRTRRRAPTRAASERASAAARGPRGPPGATALVLLVMAVVFVVYRASDLTVIELGAIVGARGRRALALPDRAVLLRRRRLPLRLRRSRSRSSCRPSSGGSASSRR